MIIKLNDFKYPEQLKNIKNPPKQLYIEGNIELLNKKGIAIIGSRNCTKYGEKMAKKFAKDLCIQGFTIISGMAKGIDSFAHIGSISTNGNTIAVLPSGLKNIYPEENIELYKKIIKNNGLVISEYKENKKANSQTFLERNRIISGLALGTLVIEGGFRSGTSVTANLTKEQGKNVFCIPSSLENRKGITPNKLIKEGAFLVTDSEDIIKQYPKLNLDKLDINNIKNTQIDDSSIDKEYKYIFDILDNENYININDIVKISKLHINEVSYKLMMLELDEKVVSIPGNYFKRK